MTKRMKRIAALLTCGLVLASGTSVYAGNAEGTLLGYPISLEVFYSDIQGYQGRIL